MDAPSLTRRAMLAVVPLAVGTAFAQAAKLPVRKDISKLKPGSPEVVLYTKAVELLKKASDAKASDPLGWLSQADIHRASCAHANWFFLPWHRAYLFFFERLCRSVLKDDSFALPYWDWTKNPAIPDVFYEAAALKHPRTLAKGKPLSPSVVGKAVMDDIKAIIRWPAFGGTEARSLGGRAKAGQLESGPHNGTHNGIGGNMSDPRFAARDPIFWLHHANVDRLWAEWAAVNGGSQPSDKAWLQMGMPTFYDAKGSRAGGKVSDYLDNRSLGYRYDTQDEERVFTTKLPVPPKGTFSGQVEAKGKVALTQRTPFATVSAKPTVRFAVAVKSIRESPEDKNPDASLSLVLEGVTVPRDPSVAIRVFLGAKASPDTAPAGPTFLGEVAVFATGGSGMDGGHAMEMAEASFLLDMTGKVRQLKGFRPGDPIDVTLVAVSYNKEWSGTVAAKEVRIAYAGEE